jgi:hypothetical protein
MSLSETLLPEFDAEMASTRRTLERIPEDKLTWKPHEKSMLLGRLAGHLAELPGFGIPALTTDKLDFAASRPADYKPLVAQSQKHVLEIFDKKVAEVRPPSLQPATKNGTRTGRSRWAKEKSSAAPAKAPSAE